MEHYYIGSLLKVGCKHRARKMFMNVLYRVNKEVKLGSYSDILARIYENSAPLLGTISIRKSGRSYLLPSFVSEKRSESVVARWVIESAKKRTDSFFLEDKLVNEILDILLFKGITLTKRSEFHKKVISNTVFMKYHFSKPIKLSNPLVSLYIRPKYKKLKKLRNRLRVFYEVWI